MKKLYALTALSALLASSPVLADDAVSNQTKSTYQPLANGGFEAKDSVEHTNANGTSTAETVDKKVSIDKNGNKETTVDVKASTDPKGLMNKTTTEVHDKAIEKDGKEEYKHKKTVNGKTVEETDEKH
ncbi:MAG: hypothetical protein M3N08_07355 [Pseudomonadota bacterium]|nr:hypothetical protein [Pseudomonadota bacterium]